MTGRPGDRTMEMNGRSTVSYLACAPCVPVLLLVFIGPEAKGISEWAHFRCAVEPSPGHIRCRDEGNSGALFHQKANQVPSNIPQRMVVVPLKSCQSLI